MFEKCPEALDYNVSWHACVFNERKTSEQLNFQLVGGGGGVKEFWNVHDLSLSPHPICYCLFIQI